MVEYWYLTDMIHSDFSSLHRTHPHTQSVNVSQAGVPECFISSLPVCRHAAGFLCWTTWLLSKHKQLVEWLRQRKNNTKKKRVTPGNRLWCLGLLFVRRRQVQMCSLIKFDLQRTVPLHNWLRLLSQELWNRELMLNIVHFLFCI